MAQAMIFHARSGSTFLHRLHPAAKFLFLLFLSITGPFLPLAVLCGIFLLLTALAVFIHLPLRQMKNSISFFIFIALLIFITEYMACQDIILSLPPVLRFTNVLLGSLLLTDTTMPSDMARGLGSFLSPVLGKAAWKFASAIELTMAMLPLITDTVIGVHEARISRGERLYRHPIKGLTGLCVSILSSLLDRVEEYADALSSRGYDNSTPRKLGRGFHLEEGIVLLLAFVILGGALWIRKA